MNREIKFRGKRIDDGKWVHGSYTSMREKNRNNPFCQVESKIFHRIWQWEDGDWNMGGYANYEVIPETVGQYTGLKDKNLKEIYEGDIIKYDFNNLNYRIEFINAEFIARRFYENIEDLYPTEFDFGKECEVLGNIYENLELLNDELKAE